VEDVSLDHFELFVALLPERSINRHLRVLIMLIYPVFEIVNFWRYVNLQPHCGFKHALEFFSLLLALEGHKIVVTFVLLAKNKLCRK
jgi:hypothetical protein